MNTKVEKHMISKTMIKELIEKVFVWVYLVLSIGIAVAFAAGVFSGREEQVSVVGAVEKIFGIFLINGNLWYYYLSAALHGVVFVVIMTFLIKSAVKVAGRVNDKERDKALSCMRREIMLSLFRCFIYVVIVSALNKTSWTGGLIAVFCVGIVLPETEKATIQFLSGKDWKYIVTDTVYFLLKVFLLGMLASFFCRPVVSEAINGIVLLFSGMDFLQGFIAINTIYQTLIVKILYIIMIVKMLNISYDVAVGYVVSEKKRWTNFIVVAAIYFAAEIFMYIELSDGVGSGGSILSEYFSVVRDASLPILLLVCAGRVSCSFYVFPSKSGEASIAEKLLTGVNTAQPNPVVSPFSMSTSQTYRQPNSFGTIDRTSGGAFIQPGTQPTSSEDGTDDVNSRE